nr:MAG TPA: hypothetical protein [Microviridae sp.]
MKNTSLFCFFFGQCQKRKPSADPAERTRARFRALGGSGVIGAKPLIARKKKAVGRPRGANPRSLPRARRKWGYRGKAPNRQLSTRASIQT